MTRSKSIHAKYGCAHCRSNITAQDRDTRQMISNINYQGEPIICEKGRPQGPTPTNHMPSVKLSAWESKLWGMPSETFLFPHMHVEPGCTLHGIEQPQAGWGWETRV